MNVLIAGGTGFIGKNIVKSMVANGHTTFILTRSKYQKSESSQVNYITWLNGKENITDSLPKVDVVINLAGDPINKGRWMKKKKERILASRKETTANLIELIRELKQKPKVFINASAIGIYGYSWNQEFTEESEPLGNSFPQIVCKSWESNALQAEKFGVRTVITRIGIVLDKNNGALPRMAMPYHLFVGGKVASGKQWISWIHIGDLVNLFHYIIENESISGPINLTSPNPVTMDELGKNIGNALHRPHWFPVPAFLLKTIFGEMSELLIYGQKVLPKKAIANGYKFTYSKIEDALHQIYR